MTHLQMLQLVKQKYPAGPNAAGAAIMLKRALGMPLTEEERWFSGFIGAASDVHKHRCPSCKVIWEHDRSKIPNTEEAYRAAHLCPKGCGVDVRDRFIEEDADHEMPFAP